MPPSQDLETAQWFESEIQPYEPELRRYLHGMTAGEKIDDLVQETYIRLLRARLKRPVRFPRGLLFSIARNAARDSFRRESVAKTNSVAEIEQLNVFDDAPGTPEVVSLRQEVAILEAAIQSLPERCRAVLILRRFHNLSHQEVATRLGITVHTVEAQLTKALRRCEQYFDKLGARPDARRK